MVRLRLWVFTTSKFTQNTKVMSTHWASSLRAWQTDFSTFKPNSTKSYVPSAYPVSLTHVMIWRRDQLSKRPFIWTLTFNYFKMETVFQWGTIAALGILCQPTVCVWRFWFFVLLSNTPEMSGKWWHYCNKKERISLWRETEKNGKENY